MKIKIECFLQKDRQGKLWLTCYPKNKAEHLCEVIEKDIICSKTIEVNFNNKKKRSEVICLNITQQE